MGQTPSPAPSLDRRELLDLYRIAVEEYRFNVTLNANRTQYYFTLNLAILGGSLSLLGSQRNLAGAALLCGTFTAALGAAALKKGHEYYRQARNQKAQVEQLLGLGNVSGPLGSPLDLSLKTTAGMKDGGTRTSGLRSGTILSYTVSILYLIAVVDLAGVLHAWRVVDWVFVRLLRLWPFVLWG